MSITYKEVCVAIAHNAGVEWALKHPTNAANPFSVGHAAGGCAACLPYEYQKDIINSFVNGAYKHQEGRIKVPEMTLDF